MILRTANRCCSSCSACASIRLPLALLHHPHAAAVLSAPHAPSPQHPSFNCSPVLHAHARTPSSACCSSSSRDAPPTSSSSPDGGIRFVYEHPARRLRLKRPSASRGKPTDVVPQVDVMLEGRPKGWSRAELEELAGDAGVEAGQAVRQALLRKAETDPRFKLPRMASLSLVLCDDMHIRALNLQHRNKDAPTDVLSFEMDDGLSYKVHLPMKLVGDVVVSLDTAQRQADERGHSLRDELRVLLVHGVLHLCGFDHERGPADAEAMAAEEERVLQALGWGGKGLISAQGGLGEQEEEERKEGEQEGKKAAGAGMGALGVIWAGAEVGAGDKGRSAVVRRAAVAAAARGGAKAPGQGGTAEAGRLPAAAAAATTGSGKAAALGGSSAEPSAGRKHKSAAGSAPGAQASGSAGASGQQAAAGPTRGSGNGGIGNSNSSSSIKLVALDMDGTLLDSRSQMRSSSVKAIRAALVKGVQVVLATGKARPAAMEACRRFGLEGDGLLVSPRSPGIFLQGLAVHGRGGTQLSDSELPPSVVAAAFRYAEASGGLVSCVAFLGDECSTLRLTPDLRELHETYYEPLARVERSLDALLRGPPVKKVLFMANADHVSSTVLPHWTATLASGSGDDAPSGSGVPGGGDGVPVPQGGASVLQAVPNMLELVPRGVNKWMGAQVLLRSLGVEREAFMAVGDGGNDLELVANAGVGVAMGNGVAAVRAAAAYVAASHDEDGIAEAFERFVL